LFAIRKHSIHHAEGIAIAEADRELIEIEREIFLGDFMEYAQDPALH
jgi:hypothetical protein